MAWILSRVDDIKEGESAVLFWELGESQIVELPILPLLSSHLGNLASGFQVHIFVFLDSLIVVDTPSIIRMPCICPPEFLV